MAMTIDSLIALDQELLTWFNGSESLFLDNFVVLLTTGITWIPLYVALFVLVMKNNEAMSQIMLVVGCAALCILFADGVADGLVKPLVGRPRPCNDPLLKYAVDIAGNYRVSGFSFFLGPCRQHHVDSGFLYPFGSEQNLYSCHVVVVAFERMDPSLPGSSLSRRRAMRFPVGCCVGLLGLSAFL